ncbi:teichoic acid transport system permease protein [Candidatus Planktophila limnetica]|uniref:Transport permease protein n=1 Tax=Candidatus Planktophila limnetica TaxID=573600 RepID=A0A249LE50_9ACTN|nr:teichoic acid transport system permease protein [Candidatus Planktophila limnetica]
MYSVNTPLQVYEPFRAGLPPLRKYWRSLWARRTFISEYSRSELREQHFDSIFGQLWLVLNPLMLSAVYFLLIVIIGGSGGSIRYGHLTASLFLFYLVSNSLSGGVKSVTAGQRLILNTAFPRMMLPISATVIAFFKFIPTLLVFMIMRTLLSLPFGWEMLWSIPIILIALIFSLGVAILISTVNVYFRDIASFLPYLTRTFLYLSPILYEASALKPEFRVFQYFNPLFSILESWSLSIVHAQTPQLSSMLTALAWALGVLLVGTYFFLSREREFAVRL